MAPIPLWTFLMCPRIEVENFVIFISKCCILQEENYKVFLMLILDAICNAVARICTWSLQYFSKAFVSSILLTATIVIFNFFQKLLQVPFY